MKMSLIDKSLLPHTIFKYHITRSKWNLIIKKVSFVYFVGMLKYKKIAQLRYLSPLFHWQTSNILRILFPSLDKHLAKLSHLSLNFLHTNTLNGVCRLGSSFFQVYLWGNDLFGLFSNSWFFFYERRLFF